jgi:hypothetical protein
MPVTVTSVTPTKTASAGGSKVEIVGTGFRLQSSMPAGPSGITPVPPDSVRVYFGTELARRVRVVSSTRILATTPSHMAGLVSVRVVNVDDFGAALEQGVLNNAITFALPDLTTQETDLVRIVRTMILELRKQVINEVVITSHVDWTDLPEAIPVEMTLPENPAIALSGPSIRRPEGVRMDPSPRYTKVGTDEEETRSPKTRDLVFSIIAIADKYTLALNLVAAIESFFTHNVRLSVARDMSVPEAGFVEYDLELEEDLNVDSTPNADSLYTASGSFAIKGVDLLGMPGFVSDLVTDRHPEITSSPDISTTAK